MQTLSSCPSVGFVRRRIPRARAFQERGTPGLPPAQAFLHGCCQNKSLANAVRNRTIIARPPPKTKGKENMNASMQILKVITMHAPKGAVPAGMKVASVAGPNVLNPLPACPVLAVGSFTLWPMSYVDNRVSFGMVMYDPKWKVVEHVEKPGARYIHKITIEGSGSSGSVTFWGQADQKVTLSLSEICHLMCKQ